MMASMMVRLMVMMVMSIRREVGCVVYVLKVERSVGGFGRD
jgi:hypothetical protein